VLGHQATSEPRTELAAEPHCISSADWRSCRQAAGSLPRRPTFQASGWVDAFAPPRLASNGTAGYRSRSATYPGAKVRDVMSEAERASDGGGAA
jgi:hypothetical protein